MNNYIYRVYGWTNGYQLIKVTTKKNVAFKYKYDQTYSKVLIIRHNIKLNMDEPFSLTFPDEVKVRKLVKEKI